MPRKKKRKKKGLSVYFIQCNGADGPVAIGLAKYPRARLTQLQESNPYPLKLIRVIPDADNDVVEKLHDELKDYWLHGEWFVWPVYTLKTFAKAE